MERWRDEPEVRLTLALLAGAGALVALGTAGVGGSLVLVVALAALTVLASLAGDELRDTAWRRVDPHAYVADLWVGFFVAGVAVLLFLDATPGEVQALGGLVGLVGMLNYFLRPVYRILFALGRRIARS